MSFMDHDMFTEQPIKDADVYFWRVVLHNWSDAFVLKALRSLIPALKLGAKVVIQDHGLADPGKDDYQTRVMRGWLSHLIPVFQPIHLFK
jgi:hypothetical protein